MRKVILQGTCLKIFQEEQSKVFLLGREGLAGFFWFFLAGAFIVNMYF